MPTYAIGDVQGCWATLAALLERIAFSPRRDRLVFVGDLVNRGPGSLEALRWAYRHAESLTVVLGNHDLHLIGRWLGVSPAKRRDTLDAVLDAPDAAELVGWLRRCPLAHREAGHLVVHGGLLPSWTADEAEARAGAVAATLQGSDVRAGALIQGLRRQPASAPSARLAPDAQIVADAQALTLLRTCSGDGTPRLDFSGPPEAAPAGCLPWFEMPGRAETRVPVVFGHWAALGLRATPLAIGIDSGAVWGRCLTALRLEDHAVAQEATRDAVRGASD